MLHLVELNWGLGQDVKIQLWLELSPAGDSEKLLPSSAKEVRWKELSFSRDAHDNSTHRRLSRGSEKPVQFPVSCREEPTRPIERKVDWRLEPFLRQTRAAHRWVWSQTKKSHHGQIVAWFCKEQMLCSLVYCLKHRVWSLTDWSYSCSASFIRNYSPF